MSASRVVRPERNVATGRAVWIMAAVAVGVIVPWMIDRLFERLLWSDLPLMFVTLWAVTAVLTGFLGIGCTWVAANKGPASADRAINISLAVMSVALTAYLVGASIPHLGGFSSSGELAGPGLDRGLIASIGYLAFGFSLAGVFLWRGKSAGGGRSSVGTRKGAAIVVVVTITVAAAYMAWATYYLESIEDGLQIVG